MATTLVKFTNCKVLRNHKIYTDDLWVRKGKIINPEKVFFDEKIRPDQIIDCHGLTIAPGFIDIQINGGFGVDFSYNINDVEKGVNLVAKKILEHGVTSFCPTVVTSPVDVYHTVLPRIKKRDGSAEGAAVLGVHVEGPFINCEKKGAHPPHCIKPFEKGLESVIETYGSLDNIKVITLAPELVNASEVITSLSKKGIVVSVGHSTGSLSDGENAVRHGASLITHLFNAMLPFHHRDPGLVGLLSSQEIPKDKIIYFGIISDGVHTHPAALRIAYRTHAPGLILVTDAISGMGLNEGRHKLGQFDIEIKNKRAYITGTGTLCGSIANMNECVKIFKKESGCSAEFALEAASLHPAKALGVDKIKGTLNYGADADFVMIDDELDVRSTWIAGECVHKRVS